jgi:hypothetical protein
MPLHLQDSYSFTMPETMLSAEGCSDYGRQVIMFESSLSWRFSLRLILILDLVLIIGKSCREAA